MYQNSAILIGQLIHIKFKNCLFSGIFLFGATWSTNEEGPVPSNDLNDCSEVIFNKLQTNYTTIKCNYIRTYIIIFNHFTGYCTRSSNCFSDSDGN